MIQGIYYKEWSTVLGREMEFKVYGHAGVPVLALPARGGRFYDWENNGMPDAIAQLLNEGKVQLFCADAVDGEGLLNGDLPQRRRAEQSVHDGVRQHIGVAVAEQALFIRHLYAAENEPPTLRQAVDVIAVSDAQTRHSSASRSSRRRRIVSATIRSSGVVILMFSSSPSVK